MARSGHRLYSCVALLLLVVASVQSSSPVEKSANRYIDLLIKRLSSNITDNSMDPLLMDDMVIGFSKKILLITVRGSIGLTDGRLYGLSTIHRSGDCSLKRENNKLTFDVKVGVNNLWGAFNGRADFMDIGVNAKLSLAIDKITVDARISASLGTGSSPDLDHFSISHVSPITIRFSGLGPLDWIVNPVTNVLVNVVRGVLVKVIEVPVRAQLKKILQSVPLPLV